ncbi:MAG: MFS transporter [Anaerolineae bacterium]|jgi:DHA1 family multidrug resistance protein-like MFS transporter
MKASNIKHVIVLSLTLAVVMLGFGMVLPIFPFYVESMGAGGLDLGLLTAISPLMQLVFAPIWGNVSDRRGRKPVLLVGLAGYGISMLLYGLASELWMLFVARGVGAILSAATLPTTYAYISDSTAEEDRGGGMGILGAAVSLGMVLGPALGGLLAVDSLSTPFFITAALSVVTLLLIAAFLPESLPEQARSRALVKTTPRLELKRLGQALLGPIGMLLLLAFLVSFGLTNFQSIFGLYALKKFGYDTQQVGWILTVTGLVAAGTQGILTGPLTKRWGEAAIIKVTLLASAIGFILLTIANSLATVLLTTGLFTLPNALLRPAVIALTSKRAGTRQGVAMGLNNSFNSLGRIAGPIWAGVMFDLNYDYAYLSGAVVMLFGFLFSLAWVSQEQGDAVPKELKPTADQYQH